MNYIKNSLETVESLIKHKDYLKVKNSSLLNIFSSEREENCTYRYKWDERTDTYKRIKTNNKEIILNMLKGYAYVEFDFPVQSFGQYYQKLSIKDLSNYSKYQLILLYEGWRIFDGIETSNLVYGADNIIRHDDFGKVLIGAPSLILPNKDCKTNYLKF